MINIEYNLPMLKATESKYHDQQGNKILLLIVGKSEVTDGKATLLPQSHAYVSPAFKSKKSHSTY